MGEDQRVSPAIPGIRRTLLLLALPLLLPSGSLRGQRLNVHHYGHAQGLPQIQVYSVFQDAEGYIWVGSNSGMARYDGREFHSITHADGLAHNTVSRIEAFPDGTLVAGTRAGICFLDPGPTYRVRSCVHSEEGLAPGQLRDLHADEDGSVWVAYDGGLSHVREGRPVRSYGPDDGLPPGDVQAVTRDAAGTLWVGTLGGLARLEEDRWEEVRLRPGLRTPVAALEPGPRGLLVGAGQGLFLKTEEGFREIPLGGERELVRQLAVGPDGAVWAGTSGRVYRIETETEVTPFAPENGIPSQAIWDLHVDREGNAWMGSDDGLWKLVPGPIAFYTDDQGLPHPFVRAMTRTPDGRLWFGTRDGLAVKDGDEIREVSMGPEARDRRIYALAPAPDGGLLMGTALGLVHRTFSGKDRWFDRESGLPHNYVMALLPDGRGGAWVGTAGGVTRWTRDGIVTPSTEDLLEARAATLARDGRGRLWVGLTAGGVVVVDGDSLLRFGPEEGLTAQTVWSLSPDEEGGMWVGTNGDGAFYVKGDNVVRNLREEDGLAQPFVWQVLVDSRGDVWLFTGNGLDRLTGRGILHYGTGEGLQDLEGAANAILEEPSGRLWFGTGSGVYRYEPAMEREKLPPPPVKLESVTVGGRFHPRGVFVFPPDPGAIVFRISAPSYRDEEGIRFRYRLAGTSDSWSEPSPDPTVRFAGLGYGAYRLEVVAETERGRRSSETLTIPFRVRPAFWQTWWFRLIVGGLLVLGILSIPFLRARHLRAEREELQRRVHEHTRELEDKTLRLEREMREREDLEAQLFQAQKMEAVGRLAGGIAHDFNNLLTSVMGYAEVAATELPDGHTVLDDLAEIRAAGARGTQLVSQLLAFSRRQVVERTTLDLGEVVRAGGGLLQRALGERIELALDVPDEPLPMRADRSQLEQILMNLALNARDAMPGGGRLEIGAREVVVTETMHGGNVDEVVPGRYIQLRITDAGEGMDRETLSRIFEPFFTTKEVGEGSGLGLAMVYGAVHQQDGAIRVASSPGEGTTFRIFFPALSGVEND